MRKLYNYMFYMNILLRVECIALLLLSAVCAHAQTMNPAPLQWQRIELGAADSRYPFAIYSNRLWQGDMSSVSAAVFVVHGVQRNGDDYYAAAEKLLRASGKSSDEVLLIALNFFSKADARKHAINGMPVWEGDKGWNGGWDAANWSRPLSSFEPIDDLLTGLLDTARFPHLQRITIAGHSSGGQFVHRYAVLNTLDEKVRAAGKRINYIIANPSSYLYFTSERPAANGFAPFDAQGCPRYDEYRYGLQQMVRYAGDVDGDRIYQRYAGRDVTYLLGTADTNPNHRVIDKSCMAKAGGASRLDRGRNYIRYERYLAKTAMILNRREYEVIDVGHNPARMFGSKCGARLLFGLAEEKNVAGAACREPQL
jgi:hypothetical protein